MYLPYDMYLYLYIGHIYMSIMYMIDRYITSTSTAHQSSNAGGLWRQEWGDAAGPGLGGGGAPAAWSKGGRSGVPTAAYCSAREEGTCCAGMLGEESLRCPYVPPSRDWGVPH